MKQNELNQLRESALKDVSEDIQYNLEKIYQKGFEDGYKAANKEKQVDPYLMKNLNFSLLTNPEDERWEKYKQQRIERGFDDSETWSLDTTIIKFILPRLKRFKEIPCGYPSYLNSEEEWDKILQTMIDWMEHYDVIMDDSEYKEGRDNFFEYFSALWT